MVNCRKGFPIGSGTGLERGGYYYCVINVTQWYYSGVLGADGPGSEGGRMPASAPVSSGGKAAGGWIPPSAPVSVSCFGT